ncbi:MAG: NDP-sugar synthase [Nitrospinota bacterium]
MSGGIERAGVLAAGEGSRLRGAAVPKPLVRVGGRPLIEWTLRGLARAGARRIDCIVNERLREVERFLLEGEFGAEVRVLVRTTESSLFSLLALRGRLEEGPFLLSTTDTILPLRDWEGFGGAASAIQDRAGEPPGLDALLGVTAFVEDENPLWVEVSGEGLAVSLGAGAEGGGLVTSGVYAFHPSVFADAETVAKNPGARLRHLLVRMADAGRRVGAYRFHRTVDVDRPEDVQTADRLLQGEGWE